MESKSREVRINSIISKMKNTQRLLNEIEQKATTNKPDPMLTALVARLNKKITKATGKLRNMESR